jgi:peptidoglycan/xylan/chitin deacetylase (PgdA/CDA1 family)
LIRSGARGTRSKHWKRRALVRLATVACVAIALTILWAGAASAASASVVFKGSAERKQIALTFDDNTSVSRALATLRALQRNEVPATLFLIGSAVKAYPSINQEIVKGMAGGWFEVGDHSYSHALLVGLPSGTIATQIGGGTDAFRKATGARTVPLFRPPYGSYDGRVAAIAGSEGFSYLVNWDVDPRDWAGGSASSIADHVISHAHNGAIVVMHLSGPHTAAAVPLMASGLRARGYELVTVSTMLKGDRLFLDVSAGAEAGQAIARMLDGGYMSGYDGNYFGPYDTITRAQVAKVATLVGGLHTEGVDGTESRSFPDVPLYRDPNGDPLPYPFDFVEEAAAAGLVMGSVGSDGTSVFRPYETITRVQLAQILARMARQLKGYGVDDSAEGQAPVPVEPLSEEETVLQEGPVSSEEATVPIEATVPMEAPVPIEATALPFPDVPEHAAADVALVVELGLMSGYSDQSFKPWAGAQRAHVALVMSRYLDLPEVWPAD